MFLYNLRYQWAITSGEAQGAVLHAVGCTKDEVESRTFPATQESFVLLDPDAYLWGLDGSTAERAVERLDSYPWTPTGPGRENPPVLTDAEVKAAISDSAQWQLARGCARAILPTPALSDPAAEIDEFLRWLDTATEVSKEVDRGCLVTLCVSDVAIRSHLERLLDQLTARSDLPGLYVMADTSGGSGTGAIGPDVARLLLQCSYLVGHRMEREVVVNFADSFGLACLAVGATAFGGGYEQKARRLDTGSYAPREGGGAFPRFFSLATTAYYRSRMDLERIRDARLLRLIEGDTTDPSEALFDALRSGRSTDAVPDWREARNNVSAARRHLIALMNGAVERVNSLPRIGERCRFALNWLQEAERNVIYLNSRLETTPLDDDGRHVSAWRAEFERFLDESGAA